jgi:hypothetical protein
MRNTLFFMNLCIIILHCISMEESAELCKRWMRLICMLNNSDDLGMHYAPLASILPVILFRAARFFIPVTE